MSFVSAVTFLFDVEAARSYVGTRSMNDVSAITRSINSSLSPSTSIINDLGLLNRNSNGYDFALSTVMYNRQSVCMRIHGRSIDWSLLDLDTGDLYEVEHEVQIIAYLLARYW